MKTYNLEFVFVERKDDEDFGIKSYGLDYLVPLVGGMELPWYYDGPIYICELDKDWLIKESKRQAEICGVKDEGYEDMLNYWCENVGFNWRYLENGNVLYATSEV